MLHLIIQNTIRFFVLVLVQVLIIKNIDLGRFVHPLLYVLYIIILPFETPKGLSLFLAFILGIVIDMFYDTAGMNAAACVFMAYARPGILKLIAPRDGYEIGSKPTVRHMGLSWFLTYSSVLILLHHLLLFLVEAFNFKNILTTLSTVFLSSVFTLLLVLITQFLFYNKKE